MSQILGSKFIEEINREVKFSALKFFSQFLSFDILILSKHEKGVMFVTKEGITCYSLHKIMHGNIECSV